jgi:hypothetical protein
VRRSQPEAPPAPAPNVSGGLLGIAVAAIAAAVVVLAMSGCGLGLLAWALL